MIALAVAESDLQLFGNPLWVEIDSDLPENALVVRNRREQRKLFYAVPFPGLVPRCELIWLKNRSSRCLLFGSFMFSGCFSYSRSFTNDISSVKRSNISKPAYRFLAS